MQQLPLDGEIVTGMLKSGDDVLPNNTYDHIYAFKGRAGQKVTVEMDSDRIAPALFLISAKQKKLIEQNDDISPNNFNARIVVTLPADGTYVVLANAFERGESGEYRLRTSIKSGIL